MIMRKKVKILYVFSHAGSSFKYKYTRHESKEAMGWKRKLKRKRRKQRIKKD